MEEKRSFKQFSEFYSYYLSQHHNKRCRLMHFIGTLFVLIIFFGSLIEGRYFYFILIPFVGYGFAWAGHYFFEKNHPTTFRYPLYSFLADFVLFKDVLLGKIKVF